MKEKQTAIILSGWSGSGKSTLAKKIAKVYINKGHTVEICSTDDYFAVGGVYQFDPTKLGLFHRLNLERYTKALKAGKSVIVDNTNTRCYEAKPYVKVAVGLGIPIYFYRAVGTFKNTHDVPDHKVKEMKNRMEFLSIENCLESLAPWEILHFSI